MREKFILKKLRNYFREILGSLSFDEILENKILINKAKILERDFFNKMI